MAADAVFLDTSLLVAATVELHPGHAGAGRYVAERVSEGAPLCISPQVCREFVVVLTRQPVEGRTFTTAEAVSALDRWRGACSLLGEDETSVARCMLLARRHQVRGKQLHDCNIVAVMTVHGVRRLGTRNARDFQRYRSIRVEAVSP